MPWRITAKVTPPPKDPDAIALVIFTTDRKPKGKYFYRTEPKKGNTVRVKIVEIKEVP